MPIKSRRRLHGRALGLDPSAEEAQTFAPAAPQWIAPIGEHPRDVPVEKMLHDVRNQPGADEVIKRYHARISSPLTAIRAKCIECVGGPAAVRQCRLVSCPNWCFRMGSNPFFGKLKESADESDEP